MQQNPYNFNLPVVDNMFFGRLKLAKNMLENLTAPVGDSYGLVGGRRMGKTSLLRKLKRDLVELREDDTHALFPVPIPFDFTGDIVTSVNDFFEQIAFNIEDEILDALGKEQEKPIGLKKGRNAGPELARCIQQWAKFVSAQTGKRLRIILLLDECERIVNASWSADLQSTLRYVLLNDKSMANIKVVMAGSHGFRTTAMVKGSPLENVLKYEHLSNFSFDGVRDLVTQPCELVVEESVVESIGAASGGHPFLAQFLLHMLWDDGLEKIDQEQIARAGRSFILTRHDFKDWSNHLGEKAWGLYGALVKAGSALSYDEWRNTLEPVPLDFVQLASGLVYHGLVNYDDESELYSVAGLMFKEWHGTQSAFPALDKPDGHEDGLEMTLVEAREFISRRFDKKKLNGEIVFNMGINWENLGGDTLDEKGISLIQHCQYRGRFGELVEMLLKARPNQIN